jgi:hypothetical protein
MPNLTGEKILADMVARSCIHGRWEGVKIAINKKREHQAKDHQQVSTVSMALTATLL